MPNCARSTWVELLFAPNGAKFNWLKTLKKLTLRSMLLVSFHSPNRFETERSVLKYFGPYIELRPIPGGKFRGGALNGKFVVNTVLHPGLAPQFPPTKLPGYGPPLRKDSSELSCRGAPLNPGGRGSQKLPLLTD